MQNQEPSKKQTLQSALGPGDDCLPVAQLEELVVEGSAAFAGHVESCTYCQAQVQLLRKFISGAPDTEDVRLITSRLRARSDEIFQSARKPAPKRQPWWGALPRIPWLSPAALAVAGILVVVSVSLQMRNSLPGLRPASSQEVLRSNAILVTAPSGDIARAPSEIRWQAAPSAVRYEARLFEVDGSELWRGATRENWIEIPPAIRTRIVPAKTLLCRVLAFDESGQGVGQSEDVRFKLSQ